MKLLILKALRGLETTRWLRHGLLFRSLRSLEFGVLSGALRAGLHVILPRSIAGRTLSARYRLSPAYIHRGLRSAYPRL